MKYHDSDIEIRIGDRVEYRHLFFGRSRGVVSYIPNDPKSKKLDDHYDTPDWVVDLESGKSVFMIYSPRIEFAHPRVRFIERVEEQNEKQSLTMRWSEAG